MGKSKSRFSSLYENNGIGAEHVFSPAGTLLLAVAPWADASLEGNLHGFVGSYD